LIVEKVLENEIRTLIQIIFYAGVCKIKNIYKVKSILLSIFYFYFFITLHTIYYKTKRYIQIRFLNKQPA